MFKIDNNISIVDFEQIKTSWVTIKYSVSMNILKAVVCMTNPGSFPTYSVSSFKMVRTDSTTII